MRTPVKIVLLVMVLVASTLVHAQSYSNDFENGYTWYPPWSNLRLVADSTETGVNHVCLCDSTNEYGFGFSIEAGKMFPRQNINCQYEFLFKAESRPTQAQVVFSIDDDSGNRYWSAHPLQTFVNDTTEWSQMRLDLNFPFDYIGEGKIKSYIWNQGKERLAFDDVRLEVEALEYSFLPKIDSLVQKEYDPESCFVLREDPNDPESAPITYPIGMFEEYIIDKDTINKFNLFIQENAHSNNNIWARVQSDISSTSIIVFNSSNISKHERRIAINCLTTQTCKVLRQTIVIPLIDSTLTVYRRNFHIDSVQFQPEYYLDKEGFTIGEGCRSFTIYHPTGKYSSIQLDATNLIAYINLDYWRDHPLIHYPLRDTIENYFEDISCQDQQVDPTENQNILQGDILCSHSFNFNIGDSVHDLPRIMPVWDGYQSAFIFTEHADWTDIRTHRAVLFGNENITKPKDAVGGFCYYNIPVTKSVFYWNPDDVTNEHFSEGRFTGLHASIKNNREYYKLLKAIKKEGFEICLHTPEQYTTIPHEFPKAMRFMKRHFGTVSWIDHGYNNGPEKNREDLVCDGLLPDSPHYAAKLWKENGVRYLWNPYYEENRMEQYNFDSHFVQPYDGFGDALPNRQITTLPDNHNDFLLWSTSSTLEVNEDYQWYYFFDSIRLQRLVDQHNVFITHIYPAWTNPDRAFWQYDEDGTIVAMPGFNFALSQLAHFRDEKKILPTTVEQYLNYYEKLQNIEYLILDNNSIQLINQGEAVKGLTLLCTKPITVEGKPVNFRKVDEGYLVWFDLGKNEIVTIKHRK